MTGPSPAKAWTSKPMPVRGTEAASEPLLGAVEIGRRSSAFRARDRLRRRRLSFRRRASTVVSSVGAGTGPAAHSALAARRGGMPAVSARGRGRCGRRARRACRRRARACRRREGPARRHRRTRGWRQAGRSPRAGRRGGRRRGPAPHRHRSRRGRRAPNPRALRRLRSIRRRSGPAERRAASSSWLLPDDHARRLHRRDGAIRDSTAQRSTGLPPSSRYCLGTPPPRRSPLPAATMRAVMVIRAARLGPLALSAKGSSPI